MHRLAKLSSEFPSIALLWISGQTSIFILPGQRWTSFTTGNISLNYLSKLVLHDAKIDQFADGSVFASLESRISATRVKEESSWMTDWHLRRNFSSPWRVQVSSVLIIDVDY